jgi:hypothetical protein
MDNIASPHKLSAQGDQRGVAPADCMLKLWQVGTKRVQMKGVLPWLVRWARRAETKDLYPAFAILVSPVQNIFSLTVRNFSLYFPIAQQPGHGQAIVQGRLVSECVSPVLPTHPSASRANNVHASSSLLPFHSFVYQADARPF